LREERRLRVFENRVLRRVFGSKSDEVKRGWRKPHNKELNYQYHLGDPGVDGRIILRWVFRKWDVGA